MTVGSSSSGKTLVLKSLLGLSSRVRPVSSISGESAFLSGTDRKKVAKDSTGGLLKELGDNGCLVFLDFTTLMSKSSEEVTSILGTLRQMYDGDFIRDVGSEGGRSLRHTGRVGLLAGVTNIIDSKDEVSREMGARALYYRPDQTAGYQESMKAVNQIYPEQMMADFQNMVVSMFYSANLFVDKPYPRRTVDTQTADRIVSIAQFAARARSHVPRDWKTGVVCDVATIEQAPRMAQEMTQLFCGMESLGILEEDCWAVVEKCALDCMTNVRRGILTSIKESEAEAEAMGAVEAPGNRLDEIARKTQISPMIIGRALEDMEILGLVERTDKESERLAAKPINLYDANGYPRPQKKGKDEGKENGGRFVKELVPGSTITGESGWGLTPWMRDKLKLTETKPVKGGEW